MFDLFSYLFEDRVFPQIKNGYFLYSHLGIKFCHCSSQNSKAQ